MSQYYKSIILSIFIGIITLLLIYSADRIVGNKFNKIYAGWNTEGYRGELKKEKDKNTKRIIALGGSTTFGYGTKSNESWPFLLEQKFISNNKDVDIVNLGGLSHGIWAIYKDIIHYEYLNYDYVIIFNGYNDVNPNILAQYSKRHNNPIFKNFGYLPTLDVYIYEKIALLLYGDLEKFYANKYNEADDIFVFDSNKKQLTEEENQKLQKKLEKLFIEKQIGTKEQIDQVDDKKKLDLEIDQAMVRKPDGSIEEPFKDYIDEYTKVLDYLTKKNVKIIVIHQPDLDNVILDLQKKKVESLLLNYPDVLVLNFRNLIDLEDKKLSTDGMHLTYDGNKIISDEIYKNLKNIF
tara:strand:- start:328 stop:1377 length:1050 start_codon:yes stop_codon:yes gene_type:complete